MSIFFPFFSCLLSCWWIFTDFIFFFRFFFREFTLYIPFFLLLFYFLFLDWFLDYFPSFSTLSFSTFFDRFALFSQVLFYFFQRTKYFPFFSFFSVSFIYFLLIFVFYQSQIFEATFRCLKNWVDIEKKYIYLFSDWNFFFSVTKQIWFTFALMRWFYFLLLIDICLMHYPAPPCVVCWVHFLNWLLVINSLVVINCFDSHLSSSWIFYLFFSWAAYYLFLVHFFFFLYKLIYLFLLSLCQLVM